MVLEKVTRLDEDSLLDAVDRLLASRLIEELPLKNGEDRYRFAQEALCQALLNTVSQRRLRWLHLAHAIPAILVLADTVPWILVTLLTYLRSLWRSIDEQAISLFEFIQQFIRLAAENATLKLSDMVGRRARRYGFIGRKVTLTIRYQDFHTFTKQATLPDYTNHTHEIYKNALSILHSIRLADSVRLLGVCLSRLIRDCNQMLLFDDKREKALLQAMDSVNDKYGDFKLAWASYLHMREPPSVISPAWRPSGVKNIRIK